MTVASPLFRVILDDLDFRALVEIDDLLLGYPDEWFGREIILVTNDVSDETIAEFDAGTQEGLLEMLEEGDADMRIKFGVHILRNLVNGRKGRVFLLTFPFRGDVVVKIGQSNDTGVHVDIVALQVKGKSGAVHALMVLQSR